MSALHIVDIPTKKATFAMGCFWGCDSLYGATKGVIRTRVGYCGGTKTIPTYRNIGDYTESIEVDYDPNEIKYETLLNIFWSNHDPTAKMKKQVGLWKIIFGFFLIKNQSRSKTLKCQLLTT